MKKIVVGNWKMQGSGDLIPAVIAAGMPPAGVAVVVCPPATLIGLVAAQLKHPDAAAGAQDCAAQESGAYTGDISARMLKEAGAKYVIVGHSERRTRHNETDDVVRQKAIQAMQAGLVPIICIGETEAERMTGQAEAVVGKQIQQSLPNEAKNKHFILAYEPVWAIGTGKTPTPQDIQHMHSTIAQAAAQRTGLAPAAISVLYGGSVNAGNAKAILALPGVAGVLVGGASVKPEEFGKIIAAAAA